MPSKSLVLFDIDGTLMRGAGAHHRQALVDGIQQVTGRLTTLEGIPTAGMLDCDLIASMLRAVGENETRIQQALPEIMRACQNFYVASCTLDLSPFLCTGVPQSLSWLRDSGAVLGLVTGNLSRIGRKKVALAGIGEYFIVGAFAEDGSTRAAVAGIAVQRAHAKGLLSKDCRISLVGDHANDVQAAKQNGFQSVAVATGMSSLAELSPANPDILVQNLNELALAQLL